MTLNRTPYMSCLLLIQAVTSVWAQERDDVALTAQRAQGAVKLGLEHATDYDIYRGERDADQLELHPAALFRFTNPVPQESDGQAQELYGAVFLWADKGCPAVVFSILNIYSPGPPFIVHELTSLSDNRVVAMRDGAREWSPDRAGIKRGLVPNALAVAKTSQGRVTQMRAMSRQFTADKTDGNRRTTQLRLISKPLFRYQSDDTSVIDGAMFAYADGTDPEVLLLLEARRGALGDQWYFAAARLNILHVKLFHREQLVWEAPYLTRAEWRNRDEPYVLLRQPSTQTPP